jgi:acetyl-CoA carboxylase alpha subunit
MHTCTYKNLIIMTVIFVCKNNCKRPSSLDGIKTVCEEEEKLHSTQDAADTRIILHSLHIAKLNKDPIRVR